jgi:hypothetical protein
MTDVYGEKRDPASRMSDRVVGSKDIDGRKKDPSSGRVPSVTEGAKS